MFFEYRFTTLRISISINMNKVYFHLKFNTVYYYISLTKFSALLTYFFHRKNKISEILQLIILSNLNQIIAIVISNKAFFYIVRVDLDHAGPVSIYAQKCCLNEFQTYFQNVFQKQKKIFARKGIQLVSLT